MTKQLSRALLALATAAWALAPGVAMAQGYPSKPIRLVVANPPGGLTDTVARMLAPRLQEALGQTIVIDNKPGANGGIAAATLMSAPADGYAFVIADGSMLTVNPLISKKLAYDPKHDFTAVSLIGTAPLFLAVHPGVPAANFDELMALARKQPGKLNYGSSGIGSTHHLTMEAIKASTGVFITHIPFRGSAASVPAMLSGEVQMVFSAYPSLAGFVKTGQVRLIAVNSQRRSPLAPNVAAVSERISGFDYAPNVILMARTGTPPEAVQRLSAEIARIAKRQDAIDLMQAAGIELVGAGPDVLATALAQEAERMLQVAKFAKLQAE